MTRRHRQRSRIVPWLALPLALACSEPERTDAPATPSAEVPLSVWVVNYPLQYFAERIGGAHVEVTFPAPRGVDPAFWSPDGDTVAGFQSADLVLLNGAGGSAWVGRATLHADRLVDTALGFADRLIAIEAAPTHQHGPTGSHSHGGSYFTVWLDPWLALEQARAIATAFSAARPERADAFERGLAALEADLLDLDARLSRAARSFGDDPVLFSHPVYAYLTARYELRARSVHWEPGAEPDAAQWRDLERSRADPPASVMFWEATPLGATTARLTALGIESRVYSPCANVPARGDWLDVMRANAEALAAGPRPGRG
ncbi:MAG: zinc ABC transporter substrate-binding protein [Deltaproteobacteria bacterium]|nr:zinc ABC transporter substrate-binding protein [Deltaproteobacteria bacterium]